MGTTVLNELIGRVPASVKLGGDNDTLTIDFADGGSAHFWHSQDCCEVVVIEDVTGNWNDLLGHPILVAEERVSTDHNGEAPPKGCDRYNDSNTWTFYSFRSVGGSVDVRWHGSSNGYYSESVSWSVSGPGEPL